VKQIYRFDTLDPPCLNEQILQKEAQRRKLQRDTILITFSATLIQLVVVLFGIYFLEVQPLISLTCIVYSLTATLSSSVITIVFTRKRRFLA